MQGIVEVQKELKQIAKPKPCYMENREQKKLRKWKWETSISILSNLCMGKNKTEQISMQIKSPIGLQTAFSCKPLIALHTLAFQHLGQRLIQDQLIKQH